MLKIARHWHTYIAVGIADGSIVFAAAVVVAVVLLT